MTRGGGIEGYSTKHWTVQDDDDMRKQEVEQEARTNLSYILFYVGATIRPILYAKDQSSLREMAVKNPESLVRGHDQLHLCTSPPISYSFCIERPIDTSPERMIHLPRLYALGLVYVKQLDCLRSPGDTSGHESRIPGMPGSIMTIAPTKLNVNTLSPHLDIVSSSQSYWS
ncbi:uncharacterized protein EI90DRAFT_3289765 [Cantharellus anzutake]|uniref:uncharacterized protein n=1 Tax=Cantharellus anzutake TaxID=1750568 RepID=UPI00190543ED|nr:uncharacterized protein EI90DRAFT_3289765 [Cantharellus anzutake]KAF8330582.1 hypothetical protein EI90DRAFT_3289765 [Cantharellus anzutake]